MPAGAAVFSGIQDLFKKVLPLIYGPAFEDGFFVGMIYYLCLPIALLWAGEKIQIRLNHFIDLSYGIYLFGWPVQQCSIYCFARFGIAVTPLKLFFISAPITIIIAAMVRLLIEKPSQKLKVALEEHFASGLTQS